MLYRPSLLPSEMHEEYSCYITASYWQLYEESNTVQIRSLYEVVPYGSSAPHEPSRPLIKMSLTAITSDLSMLSTGYSAPGPPTDLISSSSLVDLPNELLNHILDSLDILPPSGHNLIQLPSASLTRSEEQSLKSCSLVSHRLRSLTLPKLFKHTKLNPLYLTDFLAFINDTNLADHIESVTAELVGILTDFHPAWWIRILNEIRPTTFRVSCNPSAASYLAQVPIDVTDSWAFKMPLHYLELRQEPCFAQQTIFYDFPYNDIPSIIGAKPWSSIKVNEGSSLAAYNTYEYFLKKPPSLFSHIQTALNVIPVGASPRVLRNVLHTPIAVTTIHATLETLSEFSFVAIFPFYNHVDQVLKCIRRMKNLKTLSIRLCPDPSSTVFDDEIRAAKGHFDINDPWNE